MRVPAADIVLFTGVGFDVKEHHFPGFVAGNKAGVLLRRGLLELSQQGNAVGASRVGPVACRGLVGLGFAHMQFPLAPPDGHEVHTTHFEDSRMRQRGLRFQSGHNVYAIDLTVRRDLNIRGLEDRGEDVHGCDGGSVDSPLRYRAGPFCDKGHTVTALPALGLFAPESTGVAAIRRAVVGGEDDHRVIVDSEVADLVEKTAHVVIEFANYIGIEIGRIY